MPERQKRGPRHSLADTKGSQRRPPLGRGLLLNGRNHVVHGATQFLTGPDFVERRHPWREPAGEHQVLLKALGRREFLVGLFVVLADPASGDIAGLVVPPVPDGIDKRVGIHALVKARFDCRRDRLGNVDPQDVQGVIGGKRQGERDGDVPKTHPPMIQIAAPLREQAVGALGLPEPVGQHPRRLGLDRILGAADLHLGPVLGFLGHVGAFGHPTELAPQLLKRVVVDHVLLAARPRVALDLWQALLLAVGIDLADLTGHALLDQLVQFGRLDLAALGGQPLAGNLGFLFGRNRQTVGGEVADCQPTGDGCVARLDPHGGDDGGVGGLGNETRLYALLIILKPFGSREAGAGVDRIGGSWIAAIMRLSLLRVFPISRRIVLPHIVLDARRVLHRGLVGHDLVKVLEKLSVVLWDWFAPLVRRDCLHPLGVRDVVPLLLPADHASAGLSVHALLMRAAGGERGAGDKFNRRVRVAKKSRYFQWVGAPALDGQTLLFWRNGLVLHIHT